jgi:hypothetical protein
MAPFVLEHSLSAVAVPAHVQAIDKGVHLDIQLDPQV